MYEEESDQQLSDRLRGSVAFDAAPAANGSRSPTANRRIIAFSGSLRESVYFKIP